MSLLRRLSDMQQKNKNKKINKLFNQYEGDLLNYFCGMSPQQSKDFNLMVKNKDKKKWRGEK